MGNKRGWYIVCPNCGAAVYMRRWKWAARLFHRLLIAKEYTLEIEQGMCPTSLKNCRLEYHDGQ